MKATLLLLALFTLSASAATDLQLHKQQAEGSIQRERKALNSSETCINRAKTEKEFKNCNYRSSEFEIQKEEEAPDTGTTTEQLKHMY